MIDATEGITDQDARLARLVDTNDRAMVLVCNKWDAAAKLGAKIAAFVRDAHDRFPFLEYATIVFTSALTGDGVRDIIPAAIKAARFMARDVSRPRCSTRSLARASEAMDPPMVERTAAQPDVCDAGGELAAAYPRSSPTSSATYPRTTSASWSRDFATRWVLSGAPLRIEFRRLAALCRAPDARAPDSRVARARERRVSALLKRGEAPVFLRPRRSAILVLNSRLRRDPDSRFRKPVHPANRATGARSATCTAKSIRSIFRSRKFAR